MRTSTGDVLAVYAGLGQDSRKSNPSRVVGMFRFLKGDGTMGFGLGAEFEVLAVLGIMSIVEKGRRAVKAHKEAFGMS